LEDVSAESPAKEGSSQFSCGSQSTLTHALMQRCALQPHPKGHAEVALALGFKVNEIELEANGGHCDIDGDSIVDAIPASEDYAAHTK
jgi:hypothetical protein